jgi:hypothetical protein
MPMLRRASTTSATESSSPEGQSPLPTPLPPRPLTSVSLSVCRHAGSIAYVGAVDYAPGDFIGVILDEPVGKNNGACALLPSLSRLTPAPPPLPPCRDHQGRELLLLSAQERPHGEAQRPQTLRLRRLDPLLPRLRDRSENHRLTFGRARRDRWRESEEPPSRETEPVAESRTNAKKYPLLTLQLSADRA